MITLEEAEIFSRAYVCPRSIPGLPYTAEQCDDIMQVAFILLRLPVERFIVTYGGIA